jgi:uncharacterized protein DUF4010
MPEQKSPAELKAALVFGALYALVLLAVAAAKQHFGSAGLYVVAIIQNAVMITKAAKEASWAFEGRCVTHRRCSARNHPSNDASQQGAGARAQQFVSDVSSQADSNNEHHHQPKF